MKTYIKFEFSSEGTAPLEVVKEMKNLGFKPEVGEFDFSIEWETPTEYGEILRNFHKKLYGFKVFYSLYTRDE
ncbi:MAG: hypothetical protein M1481_07625 [Candidatus Thermoplasmatota archaeon]|nr:hypothetical protein [Candidatus Thermoplasmatota archaeon]MCL5963223.1 hypothetical protein [Candidatus Thermoplasmatota archaeon]